MKYAINWIGAMASVNIAITTFYAVANAVALDVQVVTVTQGDLND